MNAASTRAIRQDPPLIRFGCWRSLFSPSSNAARGALRGGRMNAASTRSIRQDPPLIRFGLMAFALHSILQRRSRRFVEAG